MDTSKITNETIATILVKALSEEFRRFVFEPVLNEDGTYKIKVTSKGVNPKVPEAAIKRIQSAINVGRTVAREIRIVYEGKD